MEDSTLWVYVVSVVVAVILIIIAVLVKKRHYADTGLSNFKGYMAQGGILAFILFILVIGFMTYGTYRIDGMLDGSNQTVFRVLWAAQLIFLILFFFAYRSPKIAMFLIVCVVLLNVGLFMYFTTLTQENMVPSWCYFPYIVLTFMLAAGCAGSMTEEGKMALNYL